MTDRPQLRRTPKDLLPEHPGLERHKVAHDLGAGEDRARPADSSRRLGARVGLPNSVSVTDARISSIDGLRAIAMTLVIAMHCGLLPAGWMGVWLFYVISGFVITRNFLAERETGIAKFPHYASFLVRRFFRIVPPYAAYIAICCVFIVLLGRPDQFQEVPYLATLTDNWWRTFHEPYIRTAAWFGFQHLWTISVEEQFYLVFPVLFFFIPAGRLPSVLAILFGLGPLIRWVLVRDLFQLGVVTVPDLSDGIYYSSIGQFDAFLLGSFLAHCETQIRNTPQFTRNFAIGSMCALMLYGAVYALLDWRAPDVTGLARLSTEIFGGGRECFIYTVTDLCAATVIILAVREWKPLRFLASRPFAWVGLNSYSGYLYHLLAITLFSMLLLHMEPRDLSLRAGEISLWIRLAAFAVTWCASVAAAYASNVLIERHARAVGHRISAMLTLPAKRMCSGTT